MIACLPLFGDAGDFAELTFEHEVVLPLGFFEFKLEPVEVLRRRSIVAGKFRVAEYLIF